MSFVSQSPTRGYSFGDSIANIVAGFVNRGATPRSQYLQNEQRIAELQAEVSRQARQARIDNDAAYRTEVETAIKAFATDLAFTLEIPGQHYSGLSNQQLFSILQDQGRNFAANTHALKSHVQQVLTDTFVTGGERVSDAAIRQYAADAILEWIVGRFEGAHHDVAMRALTAKYRAWKRRQGMPNRIGVANGDLLAAIQESGQVIVGGRAQFNTFRFPTLH